jgi:hypothetical protein
MPDITNIFNEKKTLTKVVFLGRSLINHRFGIDLYKTLNH